MIWLFWVFGQSLVSWVLSGVFLGTFGVFLCTFGVSWALSGLPGHFRGIPGHFQVLVVFGVRCWGMLSFSVRLVGFRVGGILEC